VAFAFSRFHPLEFSGFLAYPESVMGKKNALLMAFMVLCAAPAMAQEGASSVDLAPAAAENISPPMDREGRTSSGLPIPRYVSIASEKVFVRTGPALRYPIKWIYQRNKMPVEVIQEFDTWRKVRDIDGDDGWVHQSLLSGERNVIIKGERNLPVYREPTDNSRMMVLLEPGVIAKAVQCKGLWCQVTAQGYRGYAERKFLWGIYESEDFD
jgi:SH3-like domain-containing protein